MSGQPPVQPGVVDAKMKTVFAFAAEAVEGSAWVLPARMRQHCAFGEQDNGGGNAAGHARNGYSLYTFWSTRAILH